MRKLSILFAVLFLILSVAQIFAQKKPREVIVIEISVPNFENTDKRQILINRTTKTRYEKTGGRVKSVGNTVGYSCGDCSAELLAKLKEQVLTENKEMAKINSEISFYMFIARAFRMGKDKSNLSFIISDGKDCKLRKILKVYRNRQNKMQLKCGASLVAYYGFESKGGN
jgi:hypothetical protein